LSNQISNTIGAHQQAHGPDGVIFFVGRE